MTTSDINEAVGVSNGFGITAEDIDKNEGAIAGFETKIDQLNQSLNSARGQTVGSFISQIGYYTKRLKKRYQIREVYETAVRVFPEQWVRWSGDSIKIIPAGTKLFGDG